jgi:quinoprotein glucose dehydrogenase
MKILVALTSATALLAGALAAYEQAGAYQQFEGDGFDSWQESGEAFGRGPVGGTPEGMSGRFSGFIGGGFAASGHGGEAATGALSSPEFKISTSNIHFLIAGGKTPGKTAVQLLVDGKVVREATGQDSLEFRMVSWDVNELRDKTARLRAVDEATGKWGLIAIDNVLMNDVAKPVLPQPMAANAIASDLVATPVLAGNQIPSGTSMKIFADHDGKGVTAPTAFGFDEQGALFVAETNRFRFGVEDDRNNRYWYLDDLASQTTADRRALHEKWKAKRSNDWMTAKTEVIRKLVDEDGDGTADKMTVFADGFNDVLDGTGAGVFAYLGKVYFACIPKIHTLEDSNGDGSADKRGIVADGFGVRISLSGHDMNGFALGNDGRIYGTIGDRGFSVTTREGKKLHSPDAGAIFRFEPDGSNFELVHTGLRNPKEIAFDELGNGITVDNNSDQGDPSRIVYIMEGATSGWTMHHQALFTFREDIGLAVPPPSPWMTERMADTQNDSQPAFIVAPVANLTSGPSGLTYYPGTGFLESERGRFLICDYKASQAASGIHSFKVTPDGAGMKYEGARKLNWGVATTDVEYSYDGRLFVADFIGGWTSHNNGRIYALSADSAPNGGRTPDVAKIIAEGFATRSSAELGSLLAHADQRIRMRAHIQLASNQDGNAPLTAATRQTQLLTRLHGIWGLGIRARKSADNAAANTLMGLLGDSDAEVRAQACHVLGEVPGIDATKLVALLADPSPRVRSFAALAIGRQKPKGATEEILRMIAENADKDTYLRHAGVFALQGTSSAEEIAKLANHGSSAVRMAAVIALRRLESPRLADFLGDADPLVSNEAIRAIHDVPVEAARPAVAALLDNYIGKDNGRPLPPMIARRIVFSAFRVGGTENAARLIAAAASPRIDLLPRQEAIRLLRQWAEPFPVDQSLGRWAPLAKREIAPIKPALEAGVKALLAADEAMLEPTLHLAEDLKLSGEAFSEAALTRLISSAKVPGAARATALDLWIEKKPASPAKVLLPLTQDKSDEVAIKALTVLAKADPSAAASSISSALASPSGERRQAAWVLTGSLPGAAGADLITTALKELVGGKGDAHARLELLEAAALRKEPEIKSALAAYQASLGKDDPLAAYLATLEGGDAKRGELTFQTHGTAQCTRCHRVGAEDKTGGEAGPNLAGIGKAHDRKYLLESLIVPGAKVAPGYGVVSLTLNNGAALGGVLLAEAAESYDLVAGTDTWRVKKSDVKSATAPMSAMPPMASMLSQREMRDIIAYLASLQKPIGNQKAPKPKPFDPASAK